MAQELHARSRAHLSKARDEAARSRAHLSNAEDVVGNLCSILKAAIGNFPVMHFIQMQTFVCFFAGMACRSLIARKLRQRLQVTLDEARVFIDEIGFPGAVRQSESHGGDRR